MKKTGFIIAIVLAYFLLRKKDSTTSNSTTYSLPNNISPGVNYQSTYDPSFFQTGATVNTNELPYIVLPLQPSGGDNTAQIVYHINRAKNENKALFFKRYATPYIVTDTIALTCSIMSDGAEIKQTGFDKTLFSITNQDGLSVRNIKLDVNARTQLSELAYAKHSGILIVGSRNISVQNLDVKKYWGAAVSLNNCFDCHVDDVLCIDSVSTNDLWAGNLEHGDTDIAINSTVSGARNRVTNCRCFSHKSSIGIGVNSLGNDTMNTIQNNYCAALKPDFTTAPANEVLKRHGIQLGFTPSLNKTFNRATGNYCFNTTTTGISIASQGDFQAVDVSHNYCEKNGIGSLDGAILRGGIHFQNFGFGSTCTDNVIVDFQTNDNAAGALSFVRAAGVVEEGTLFCDNNSILNSASHGVYIGYRSSNIHLKNTSIKGSAKSDIWYFDMTANAHDIKIENIFTERTNNAYPSIRIQNQHSMKGFSIKGGRLQGMSDTVNDDNVGVWVLQGAIAGMHPIKIEDIDIDGFGTGIGLYNPITTDIRNNVIIRGVRFTNLIDGLAARGGDANGLLPCFECTFNGVTNKTSGWGYANAARVATPTYTLTT